MTDQDERRVTKLRMLCTARAWGILANVRKPVTERLSVAVRRSGFARVRISVTPTDGIGSGSRAGEPARVGAWLSPTCNLIVTKLGGETMTRVELCRRCQMNYDPRFKTLVTDLIDRGIIEEPDDGGGVRLARKPK